MRLLVMYSKIDKEFHTQTHNYETKITEKICYAHKYCTVQRKKAITSTCGSLFFFSAFCFCSWIIFTRATEFVSFSLGTRHKKVVHTIRLICLFFIKICTCALCSWKWHLPKQHETLYHKLRYFQTLFHQIRLVWISLRVRGLRDRQIRI